MMMTEEEEIPMMTEERMPGYFRLRANIKAKIILAGIDVGVRCRRIR